ncbi:hypothetical protein SAMN05216252_104470 [Actinacidiphila glaucinigra]|uniref:DUF3592 domain-containing protein n=1 Tax=Actinacidiphila glaucinigra TaxID=235986 RepID=A0A239DAF3_9ACTN|nr:hypothetical protein SAMN05216252_104470 [Actinacidiphila glaucinigra]
MRGGRRTQGHGSGEGPVAGSAHPLVLFLAGAVFLVAGVWLLTAAARDTLAVRYGVHTVGTVREADDDSGDGRLWVTFTVAGAEVTHPLPPGTNRRQASHGDRLPIVYRADRPERVVARRDVGHGPLLFWSGFTAVGIVLVGWSGLALHRSGRRRAHPGPGRAAG